ncbi:uncharacterized protein LOC114177267 [Vigna unguiculata]|uniref:uncharacterized protein LOC114177267 n=1 Tax=Vigna unguiculata TaxID=3917 RepID=UPI0010163826|nr:uncharacterized protein LOC114177267 [Vigna unguiculata]
MSDLNIAVTAKMESCSVDRERLEMFEVGPCKDAYEMGLLIGRRFSKLIRSRVDIDLILQNHLRPFALAHTPRSESLLKALFHANKTKFPTHWDELLGTAAGSGVPLLDILLINFRKEILAFIPKEEAKGVTFDTSDDCSDVVVVGESMAVVAHNEDANVALVGHTYLIKGILPNGLFFVGYTYAGELPSCAFGFNSHGLAFTLDSVPPAEDEIVAGGIGRNFISRDLLEATSMDDALRRIQSSEVSVGHSYNLIETKSRRIFNVETASRNRISVYEVGEKPFFHANMYLHLPINQVHDENSMSRQKRASVLSKTSKGDFLSLLGDMEDKNYPIYMTGPLLHTLCTAIIDLDEQTLSIIEGNPKKSAVSHVFSIAPQKSP